MELCRFYEKGWTVLVEGLAAKTRLEKVSLEKCLGFDVVRLVTCTGLKALCVKDFALKLLKGVAVVVDSVSGLERLELRFFNQADLVSLKNFARALSESRVKHVSLSRSSFCEAGIQSIIVSHQRCHQRRQRKLSRHNNRRSNPLQPSRVKRSRTSQVSVMSPSAAAPPNRSRQYNQEHLSQERLIWLVVTVTRTAIRSRLRKTFAYQCSSRLSSDSSIASAFIGIVFAALAISIF